MADPDNGDKPRSGRVRHDAGGRAIWEWARDSGRSAVDSTSKLLKKLELTGITLMGDEARPWEKKSGQASSDTPDLRIREPGEDPPVEREPPASRGFNPYDTRTPTGRGVPPAKKPAAPAQPRITQPPRRKPGLLARLFGRK